MIKKQMYAAPAIEVLELRLEGVIATSNVDSTGENFTNGWISDED